MREDVALIWLLFDRNSYTGAGRVVRFAAHSGPGKASMKMNIEPLNERRDMSESPNLAPIRKTIPLPAE